MYVDPTSAVAALQAMLLACPTIVGLGWGSSKIHYPSAATVDDAGVTLIDALPLMEVEDLGENARGIVAGGAVVTSGRLSVTICAALSIGVLESIARSVMRELRLQETGLPITDVDAGMSTDVTATQQAGQDSTGAPAGQIAFKRCTLLISYALNG